MKRLKILYILCVLCFWSRESVAFFWGGDSPDSASGLNVAAGFDVNTITTIIGAVTVLPERRGQEQQAVMTVLSPRGTVTVVLGPWWFWEKQGLAVTKHQEFTVTGSLAQGKDGALYLFAQRIENRSSGEFTTLRSESGKPLWSGIGAGSQSGTHIGPRSGAGNRGNGMRGGRR